MNSDRRPADTVAKLADYLYWLLPNFLKRKDRAQSLVARLCDVWGEELGEGRTTLEEIIPLLLVDTATGAWLDQLARARQIFRGEGESDESLRTRVLAAHEIKRKGGTIPGMVSGLAAIGYGVQVEEPFKGTPKWAHFEVKVFTWDGVVADQKVFYLVVRILKPAHTRALIESLLLPETFDDWEPLDPPKGFDDGGAFDGWLPTA
jgi:hypothetical protein